MDGVFRGWSGTKKRWAIGAVLCLVLAACGSDASIPETTVPPVEAAPESLDGFWLLTGTDLTIAIDLETATVDGRTDCARLLGSLTFENSGGRTSFSLPGRDDSRCSAGERTAVDDVVEMLETVQSAEAEPGAYVLFDGDRTELGRLTSGA